MTAGKYGLQMLFLGKRMASKRVVAVVSDLMFTAKIQDAAKHGGAEVVFVKSKQQAIEAAKSGPALMIIDLNERGLDALDLIATLKADDQTRAVHLLGFVSHVETDLRRAALDKGCDEVLPRSAFSKNVQAILDKAVSG
jgi:CheY-like chemotaxis protein